MRYFNQGDRIEITNCILDNTHWNGRKGMVTHVYTNPFCPYHNLYEIELDEEIPDNPHIYGRRRDGTPVPLLPANVLRLYHFQLLFVQNDWDI